MTSKRIQILQAIQAGAVTLNEMDERIDLPRRNIQDNVKACVQDGLLDKFRDDVTGLPAYKLTKAGLVKLASEANTKTTTTQAGSGDITPAAAHRATSLAPRNSGEGAAVMGPPQPEPTVKESLITQKPVAVRSDDMPTDKACCNAAKVVATTAGGVVSELQTKLDHAEKDADSLSNAIIKFCGITYELLPAGNKYPINLYECSVKLESYINQQKALIANLNDQIDALSHNAPVVTDRFIVTNNYFIAKSESEANDMAFKMAKEIICDSPVIVFTPHRARELRINWRDA